MTWGDPALSAFIAAAYLGLLSLLWLLLWAGVPHWGRRWMLPRPEGDPPAAGPKLSICVPARDEADNIAACVSAALASRWPSLEVLVVDDQSSDGTAEIAAAAAGGDPRFVLVPGTAPPRGWAGKPWACARAAGEATGALLLFIDADVTLAPDAVPALVGELGRRRLSLLSAFGSWKLESFWERVMIPAVGWLIRGVVDLDRVNDPGRPEAFANGQCILVDRAGYDAMDGHGVVADQVLDDVRLAEAFKQRGLPTGLMVAPWLFEVRLYRNLSEIIAGYAKNLYEGLGRRPALGLGAVLFIGVGALLPFVGLVGGVVARLALHWTVPQTPWLAWFAVICGLQVAFRWRVERRDGRQGGIAWAHPIANLVLAWILMRAVFSVQATWKGRRFVDGRAQAD